MPQCPEQDSRPSRGVLRDSCRAGYDEDKTKQYPVLYFLHGLGGNEQILLNTGGMNIEDLRAAG